MKRTVITMIASLFAMGTTAIAQQNPIPGADGNKYVPYDCGNQYLL